MNSLLFARREMMQVLVAAALVWSLSGCSVSAAPEPGQGIGVVSHIKVLSDKVADFSSLDAWAKSFIKPGMTDQEKAVAIWKSTLSFVYQDAPPIEFLHEGCVHDSIKSFNVYGYGMCCCASARIEQLARYLGLPARGFGINGHSVPEVFWDSDWHMLDASLANYFTSTDGRIASVSNICQAVQGWLAEHPGYKGSGDKLTEFQRADAWTGWKKGPALLAQCAAYDAGGWWPSKTHGWVSTMQEYDGTHGTPFSYEYSYSQGYEVNIQLRRGERLTRNWSNNGLHVNGILKDADAPGCLNARVGEGAMAFLRTFGDLNDGRVGSGKHEYEVPLADGGFRGGALLTRNLASRVEEPGPALHVKDPQSPGVLEVAMPSSYVYLQGKVLLNAVVGPSGEVRLWFSDNNGLHWRPITTLKTNGQHEVDLSKFVLRHYDYRLRVELAGAGTGLDRLNISHDIQCSQRALPTLGLGENTISFSAGPQEGTVTIEGSTQEGKQGKQVTPMDFHPELNGVEPRNFQVARDGASATFRVATPGPMTRLRMGGHYRLRDARDRWDLQVSFDGGQTFRIVDTQTGPYQGICKYVTVNDIPPGTTAAQVRWVGFQRNTTCLFLMRIDADYAQPSGGFSPVRIIYTWEEDGIAKTDMHVPRTPAETYKIVCNSRPKMKTIVLERAE